MSQKKRRYNILSSPTCPFSVGVLFRPKWSNDVQTDVGSTVCSPLHSSLQLWPLTLDPDWTTGPLWRRPLLSWMPGHKSSPVGESHCWVAAASRRLGCGSGLDWAPHHQQPGKVRKLDKDKFLLIDCTGSCNMSFFNKWIGLTLAWIKTQTLQQSSVHSIPYSGFVYRSSGHFVWSFVLCGH